MRGTAVRSGFVHEFFSLQDAKAMLLIDSNKSEAGEGNVVFDERMSADDEIGFAVCNALQRGCFFGVLHATNEEFYLVAGFFQDAASGKKMLDGKNFSGRHESGLAVVFDGDDSGLKGDDGFSAADVTLQQAIHRHWLFEVGGDFREDPLLRGGGLEG